VLRIAPTLNADQRKVAAVAAKTTPGLVAARSRPPSAGPAKLPTLSIADDETFDAVSSSGERASDGSSAACAGRNVFDASETNAAIA
jgi:hypothetical protein